MNKFGTRDLPRLIDELRFQERRHATFNEGQLSKLLQDAADSLKPPTGIIWLWKVH